MEHAAAQQFDQVTLSGRQWWIHVVVGAGLRVGRAEQGLQFVRTLGAFEISPS
jgi:hypothetical protein